MSGRLLRVQLGSAEENVALEEALFRLCREPTLRLWESQASVVIGRAQLASGETDLELCRRLGVPVVRRFTAGGAVYNGPGNLNWSFFAPKGAESGPVAYEKDPAKVFRSVGAVLAEATRLAGREAEFVLPNRMAVGGKKVSGMAAYVGSGAVLCHGTMLLEADLGLAQELTRPSPSELERRYTRSAFTQIENLRVGRAAFERAVREASRMDSESSLTEEESDLERELFLRKYSRDDWNLGDPFGSDYP